VCYTDTLRKKGGVLRKTFTVFAEMSADISPVGKGTSQTLRREIAIDAQAVIWRRK